jgi:hypothetical protein
MKNILEYTIDNVTMETVDHLINDVCSTLYHDTKHTCYLKELRENSSTFERLICLFQFLDIHLHLRHRITYDNVYDMSVGVLRKINPHKSDIENDVRTACYFLCQDFLYKNLRKKKAK